MNKERADKILEFCTGPNFSESWVQSRKDAIVKALNEVEKRGQKELRGLVSSLFWEMTRQREKVPGTLSRILDIIYEGFSEDARRKIKKEILEHMK